MKLSSLVTAAALTILAVAVPAAAQRVAPIAPPRPAAPPSSASAVNTPRDIKPRLESTLKMDTYVLGPGDKLRIEVYRDTQVSQSVQIRPDGKITLPLLGDVEASGKTPVQLRDSLADALKEYINNPVVTVIVVEATASTAYIVGEVFHPGAVALQGDMTVLQALAVAGGLRDFANEKNIRILRKSAAGTETIKFNYKAAMKGEGAPVYLRPGDTVVVPD